MSDDLVTWLRAQIDDDEQIARAAYGANWEVGPTFGGRDNRVYVREVGVLIDSVGTCVIAGQVSNTPQYRANAEHIARHDPARALREVEAMRSQLDWLDQLQDAMNEADWWSAPDLDEFRKLMALRYAGRPGYLDEWRP